MRVTSQVWEDALALPVEEREALARALLDSVSESSDVGEAAQLVEIERRLDSIDDGTAELVPWGEMHDRLRGWAGAGRGTPRR